MWIFTTRGFYSVVQDASDPNMVVIRARHRDDLVALPFLSAAPDHIIETPQADYPVRVRMQKRIWVEDILPALGEEITYPNFKDAVKKQQGVVRANVYTRVWAELHDLEENRPTTPPRRQRRRKEANGPESYATGRGNALTRNGRRSS
jgi:hypothetical protein